MINYCQRQDPTGFKTGIQCCGPDSENPDPDPTFQRINSWLKKMFLFFKSKLSIYLFLGLYNSICVGHFYLPGSGSGLQIGIRIQGPY